jgi:hypothetical protein
MEAQGPPLVASDATAATMLPPARLLELMGGSSKVIDHHATIMPPIPAPSHAPPMGLAPSSTQGMGALGHLKPCHPWGMSCVPLVPISTWLNPTLLNDRSKILHNIKPYHILRAMHVALHFCVISWCQHISGKEIRMTERIQDWDSSTLISLTQNFLTSYALQCLSF